MAFQCMAQATGGNISYWGVKVEPHLLSSTRQETGKHFASIAVGSHRVPMREASLRVNPTLGEGLD